MNSFEKFVWGMIVLAVIVLMVGIGFISWDHASRTEDHKFKLELLKLARPINDYEKIMQRLERIERTLATE